MARVNVRKARKSYTCGGCGDAITPGTQYRWAKTRYGPKITRCMKVECTIKQSELTGSEKLSTLYAVVEGLDELKVDSYDSLEDLATDVRGFSEQVTEVAEMYRESASNIEDGFGHSTMQSEELEQKADDVESWASEIEEAASNIEGIEVLCNCTHSPSHHKAEAGDESTTAMICVLCKAAHDFEADDESWREEAGNFIVDASGSIPV